MLISAPQRVAASCLRTSVKGRGQETDNRRTRFLTLDEVQLLGEACDQLEAEGISIKALNIARLWVLTGCGRQEIAELKWSEIDFDRGLLTLADSKTGRSVRPFANAALALLKSIDREGESDFVFSADRGEGFSREQRPSGQKS